MVIGALQKECYSNNRYFLLPPPMAHLFIFLFEPPLLTPFLSHLSLPAKAQKVTKFEEMSLPLLCVSDLLFAEMCILHNYLDDYIQK